ncbi:MAG: hypothetical protein NT088_05440 [Candidatus Omnitrophica bacterium]|nr:hypothetical protein [Candidatus Omnitrophota bacterium]
MKNMHEAPELIKFKEDLRHALHRLNNCLFIISGKTELLLEEDLPPEVRGHLKAIRENLDKIQSIIKEASK